MNAERTSQRGFHAMTVRRPIGLMVGLVTLLVIGVIAYVRIPIQMLPSGLGGTRLTVWVSHPDSSAQENEEKVARPIEEQFRTLPDLESVLSTSEAGRVILRVSFNGDARMDLAKAELRDRIERARPLLPDSVDRINVWSNDDGDLPIMFFSILVKNVDANTDYLIEHHIQRSVEAIDGVSRVQIWGLLDDSVRILLDEDKVKAARLDLGALVQRLMTDNFTEPMGEVTDGGRRFLLRSDMRFESLEEVEEFPIGAGLRLADIASVEWVKSVRDRLTRIDGSTAYWGIVQKESTANIVEVGHRAERVIEGFASDPVLAGNVGIEVFFNQAKFIETSLGRLEQTALWGGGLAVLVLFAFLRRLRMTLCVALSIPVSALLSVAFEYFTGGTFNVLTMTGLTLGIGMLVDNSVVVIENIARLRLAGRSGKDAAVEGVRDVGLAIALATLTSVVVFLPLIFMGDNPTMRLMLGALGLPLCVSLLFSLLVALVFLPVIAARILTGRPRWVDTAAARLTPLVEIPVRGLAQLVGLVRYLGFRAIGLLWHVERIALAVLTPLRWPIAAGLVALVVWCLTGTGRELGALGRRLDALGIPAASARVPMGVLVLGALLAAAAALFALVGLPRWRRSIGGAPRRPARLAPAGTSILGWIQSANRALLAWTMRRRLLATAFAFLALVSVVIPMGKMKITAFGQDDETTELEIDVDLEDNFTLAQTSAEMECYEEFLEPYRERWGIAHIITHFWPAGGELQLRWDDRQDPQLLEARRRELRRDMPRHAGHRLRFSGEQQLGEAHRQFVSFQIRGPSAEELERYGEQAIEILRTVPGLDDIKSPLESAPEQVRLTFDDETANRYGVTAEAALRNIGWALRGAQLPRYHESEREVPFIIEYDSERLAGLDTLRDLEIYTMESVVPLTSFAEIDFQPGQRQIWRWNGQTTFTIQARVSDPNRQGELVEAGYTALEGLDLPRGFSLGRDDSVIVRQQQETGQMQRALMLSVVLVFLLMGILFESLLLPFSVLTTIPFAVVGALWTLYLTGTTMDSVGWIGVIILVGVVVNNGIVLIDKIHRVRLAGTERTSAVLEGAAARVRPILMTALTTVFGLLPMALGDAAREGIDYRALATCVAGGLTVSTFFTLWVVPLAYTVMDDLTHRLSWLWRRTLHFGPLGGGELHPGGGPSTVGLRAPEPD